MWNLLNPTYWHQEKVSQHDHDADHVNSHVAYTVQDILHPVHWKVLDHPPYSLEMSPCDFSVVILLRKVLNGSGLRMAEDIRAVVVQ